MMLIGNMNESGRLYIQDVVILSSYLLLLIAIPVMINVDYLLQLWLGNYS